MNRPLPRSTHQLTRAFACALVLALLPIALASQTAQSAASKVDGIFATWTQTTPGRAVGVAVDGKPTLANGYGMADLEHDVAFTPETIFEAGSVSTQFTAAAHDLVTQGYLLAADVPVVGDSAGRHWDYLMSPPTASVPR